MIIFSSVRPLLALALMVSVSVQGLQTTVQVCQNKDCCQRFEGSTNLVRTLYDLLPPSTAKDVKIESSGCLSQCGKGPNMSVQKNGKEEILILGVKDAASAAVELELSCSVTPHPTLLAAVNVMEKAQKAQSPQDKLKFLNSVVRKLDETGLSESSANARAHCLRAQVYLDLRENERAKKDARKAVSLRPEYIPLPTNAWRIVADTEEATGNYAGAIEALQKWGETNPSFTTKVSKEIKRLRSIMS